MEGAEEGGHGRGMSRRFVQAQNVADRLLHSIYKLQMLNVKSGTSGARLFSLKP